MTKLPRNDLQRNNEHVIVSSTARNASDACPCFITCARSRRDVDIPASIVGAPTRFRLRARRYRCLDTSSAQRFEARRPSRFSLHRRCVCDPRPAPRLRLVPALRLGRHRVRPERLRPGREGLLARKDVRHQVRLRISRFARHVGIPSSIPRHRVESHGERGGQGV